MVQLQTILQFQTGYEKEAFYPLNYLPGIWMDWQMNYLTVMLVVILMINVSTILWMQLILHHSTYWHGNAESAWCLPQLWNCKWFLFIKRNVTHYLVLLYLSVLNHWDLSMKPNIWVLLSTTWIKMTKTCLDKWGLYMRVVIGYFVCIVIAVMM